MRSLTVIIVLIGITFANASALRLLPGSIPEGPTLDEVKLNYSASVKPAG